MSKGIQIRKDFTDGESLACELAGRVATDLRQSIKNRGQAVLALSGGSTPVRFFEILSGQEVDWAKVTFMLVDERWVPATHERSNEKLVRDHLMQGPAAGANFVGLYHDAPLPDDAIIDVSEKQPDQIDIVILGMGPDGHTASFFPGGDNLAMATNLNNTSNVISMRAGGAGEPRITLTLSALLKAPTLILHIEGQTKADVLEQACLPGPVDEAPIRCVLNQSERPVHIYWAP